MTTSNHFNSIIKILLIFRNFTSFLKFINSNCCIKLFKYRYETAPGPCKLCGAVFTINTATRLCTKVERVTVL